MKTFINTIQIITLDEKTKTRTIYATINTKEKAIEFIEYLIHSCTNAEQFFVHELCSDKAVKMLDLYKRITQ